MNDETPPLGELTPAQLRDLVDLHQALSEVETAAPFGVPPVPAEVRARAERALRIRERMDLAARMGHPMTWEAAEDGLDGPPEERRLVAFSEDLLRREDPPNDG